VHYPYARGARCDLPTYFAQWYVRIGIPLLVMICFIEFCGGIVGEDVAVAPRGVLWSLWCELIYYTLYPLLLIGFRWVGFVPIIAVSFIAAYLVIISHWDLMTYWAYSRKIGWIAALPAWLLGCAIAQILAAGRLSALPGSVWLWRATAVALSIAPKALVYASVSPVLIGNPATLTVFSLFVVADKGARDVRTQPAAGAAGAGRPLALFALSGPQCIIVAFLQLSQPSNPLARWPLQMGAILVASYVFYRVVERPAHLLARSLGRRLARQRVEDIAANARVASLNS
jgi:peptidoglycan/LPS O-acetylase OafA/YrhL